MRASVVLALACAACGGAQAAEPEQPAAPERAFLSLRAPRSVGVYACERSVTVREERQRPMSVPARVVLRSFEDEGANRWLRTRTYAASEGGRRGEVTRGLGVRALLDGRGSFAEPPTVTGARAQILGLGALVAERLLEPYLPGDAVAVGDEWREPPYTLSPPPLTGELAVDRRFRLVAIEGREPTRRATVAWEVVVRLEQLTFQGMTLGGEVRAEGVRSFRVEDPTHGHTSLDVHVDVGPVGVAGMLGGIRVEAKVRDRCAPDENPGLINGVPPVDPRRDR